MTANTYPIIIAIILCGALVGALVCRDKSSGDASEKTNIATLLLTLLFCVSFALTFESYGALSGAFALCLTLGVIWSAQYKLGNFVAGLVVSSLCTAGIWIVFERVFSLSLP